MKESDNVDIDHITPISEGGSDELSNLRISHPSCNRKHGAAISNKWFYKEKEGT